MKSNLSIILILVLALTLTACTQNAKEDSSLVPEEEKTTSKFLNDLKDIRDRDSKESTNITFDGV